jgi:hypothetical protein
MMMVMMMIVIKNRGIFTSPAKKERLSILWKRRRRGAMK